jgi:hypothetical protein
VTGKVVLDAPGLAGGTVVTLSDNSAGADEPASVTVPEGAFSAAFTITTTPVASKVSVTVTAKLGTVTKTTSLAIVPPSLVSVSLTPTSVQGGKPSTGRVTINGPAPTGGITVNVTRSGTNATVPPKVTIPAGATFVKFAITTKAVTASETSIITCTLGTGTQTATLTITP